MVKINNDSSDILVLLKEYPENSIERKVLSKMIESKEEYIYDSIDELKFELKLRREIVNSAIALNKSGLEFKVFKESKANPEYWERKESGGFLLKDGVKPSVAINDIFTNGYKYGTECATAMTITYYKALLNVFGEEKFNQTFKSIYLMDWDVREPLLKEIRTMKPVSDVLLGDRLYFANPEVNPKTPELQGENVIVLDNSKYYGHGMGIVTADRIIKELNANRKKDATESAYLMSTAGRPDFRKLSKAYYNEEIPTETIIWEGFPMPILFSR